MNGPARCILFGCLLSCLLCTSAARQADAAWLFDAGLTAVYDDNINRTADQDDRKSDILAVPRASVGHHTAIGGATSLVLSADVQGSSHVHYSGLDDVTAGASVSLKHKWGLGSYAPWARVGGSAGYVSAREPGRSGASYTASVAAGKRLGERLFADLRYDYDTMQAREPVYAVHGSTVGIGGDYLLTTASQLTLRYSFRRGGNVMYERYTTVPGYPPAYGPNEVIVDTFGYPAEAYGLSADTHTVSATVGAALGTDWSVAAGVDRRLISGGGHRYDDTTVRAGIQYAY